MQTSRLIYHSERQLKRRAKILKTARGLVSKFGYDGLTMRGLADAVKVSPKTLYNLYQSKDELLLSALDDLLTELTQSVRQARNVRGFNYLFLRQEIFSEEIRRSPGYADAMTRALFQAKPEDKLVYNLLTIPIREILIQLTHEKRQGSLINGLNLNHIARHITLQDWCVLLLWNKGTIDLKQIALENKRSLLITLVAITKAKIHNQFRSELANLYALQ